MVDEVLAVSFQAQQQTGPDLRQIHAKSHGLVWGEFIIEPNLPEILRVGLFKTPQTYPAWIRFSSGGAPERRGKFRSDRDPDIRGFAIKVMNVPGQKVLDDEENTQDFTLNNWPTFFVNDIEGYADIFRAASGKLSPERMEELQSSYAILQQIGSQKVGNPLFIQYWSMAAFRFGDRVVKMTVKPQEPEIAPETLPESENYLREAMVEYLTGKGKDAYFDFLIQFYVNDDKTPIEQLMQEWKEEDSPFMRVATVRIPAQKFNFNERLRLDEGMFFTPWHTLSEHEPVGSVNLSRKKIYQELANYRRENIAKRLREPQPYADVQDEPS
ncbi:catalase [Scytonema sp. UIC 10036]|nr:catalase family protein [Scytonema sp. UIC 10036]MUG96576.1 catalase [Scytonema sp. UIC 10036]